MLYDTGIDELDYEQIDRVLSTYYQITDLHYVADEINAGMVNAYVVPHDDVVQRIVHVERRKEHTVVITLEYGDTEVCFDDIYVYIPKSDPVKVYNPDAGKACASAIRDLMLVIAMFWEMSTPDEWRSYHRAVAHETGWRYLGANIAYDENGDLIKTPKAIYLPVSNK